MIEALNGYVVSQRLREDDQFVLLRARRLADDVPVLLLGARDGRRDSGERIPHARSCSTDCRCPGSVRSASVLAVKFINSCTL